MCFVTDETREVEVKVKGSTTTSCILLESYVPRGAPLFQLGNAMRGGVGAVHLKVRRKL